MAAEKDWISFIEENKRGNDYVVGDIHGCLDALMLLLAKANFNPHRDRLFSVGDLVDRGDKSAQCLELLKKPWFFATRGNHEQLLLDHWKNPEKPPFDPRWLAGATDDMISEWSKMISKMPHVIKVGTGRNSFYIMHAELWEQGQLLSQEMIDACDFHDAKQARNKCLWSRHVIGTHWRLSRTKFHLPNLGRIFCGHTIVQIPIMVENAVYLDTGAFAPFLDPANALAEHFGLSMVCAKTLRHWFAPTGEQHRGKVIEMNQISAELASPTLFVESAQTESQDDNLDQNFQQVKGVSN